MYKALLSVFLITLLSLPVHALDMAHIATVTEVVDGDTVIIAPAYQGLNEVRLVGVQAPKLPLGRANFKTWPLAPEAMAYVEALVLDRRVGLWFGGTDRDRHGRILAHLFLMDGDAPGDWVQGQILKDGMARVYSFVDNRARVAEMLTLERDARASGRGIWALEYYRVRSSKAAPLLRRTGSFQVIEGRVRDTAEVKRRIYLNFGDDWRTDFTASIDPRRRKTFDDGPFNPLDLKNKRVRVRGWISNRNGPMIRVTHPEQIEILD